MKKKTNHTQAYYTKQNDGKNRRSALLITSVLYAVLILFFISMGLTTPLPLPEEEGHFVLVGQEDVGGGTIEPEPEPVEKSEVAEEINQEEPTEEVVEEPIEVVEEMETTNEPEAPEVEVKKEEKKNPVKEPVEKPVETENKEKPVEENKEEKEEKATNPFLFNKNKGIGEGEKEGIKGEKEEKTDGLNYNAKPKGGDGISFDLGGRSIEKYPSISDDSQESAIVVVEIMVDKEGMVVSVRAGVKGSTTTDQKLLKKAEIAAKQTLFNKAPNANETQSGTMTFNFKLQ